MPDSALKLQFTSPMPFVDEVHELIASKLIESIEKPVVSKRPSVPRRPNGALVPVSGKPVTKPGFFSRSRGVQD